MARIAGTPNKKGKAENTDRARCCKCNKRRYKSYMIETITSRYYSKVKSYRCKDC